MQRGSTRISYGDARSQRMTGQETTARTSLWTNFSETTGRDCSSSTTSVNRRGPPLTSRVELGIHGLNRWTVKC